MSQDRAVTVKGKYYLPPSRWNSPMTVAIIMCNIRRRIRSTSLKEEEGAKRERGKNCFSRDWAGG